MRIYPTPSIFNPKRLLYEIKGISLNVDKGKEVVTLSKKGILKITDAKKLGILSLSSNGSEAKVKVKNSDVACIYIHGNDVVEFENCKMLNQPKPHKPTFWDDFWD